jgi:toxin ParE1/3/4
MKRRYFLAADADEDFTQCCLDLAARAGEEVAERFFEAVRESCERIAAMPEIGRSQETYSPKLVGMRRWHVKGFDKFLIFYRILPDEIEILRIVHGARDLPTLLADDD